MSDPKWATDIANKKPLLSYDAIAGTDSFSDTGSSTNSTSTVGAKRDTIYGHTNRNHIWTPGTFTGAVSFVKNLLSSAMFDVLGIFVGGKSETIHNCDSRKIFGGKKRIRVGYKYKIPKLNIFPLGQAIGEMPWKEESFSIGDRFDTVNGEIERVVVNGGEKKIYSNAKSTWGKSVAKVLGIPVKNWEGLTYSTINAATGYSFTTDKNYHVFATRAQEKNQITFGAMCTGGQLSELGIYSARDEYGIRLHTGKFISDNQESIENTSRKRTIRGNQINISSKESLNLGVSRSTIRIKKANVEISNRVDLGGPGVEVDDGEREARERAEIEQAKAAMAQQIAAQNALVLNQLLQAEPPVPIPA